ncbi:MAG: PIG-L deacetylase family protein [Oscillospiraceae bacterium]
MKILVVAPHADDEILGVGGTIAKHIASGDEVYACVATRPFEPIFKEGVFQIIRGETQKAHECLHIKKTYYLELPTVMLEQIPRHELNDKICAVVTEVMPDVVYIPHFGDMQKDHQLIAEAAMVAVRPKYAHKVSTIYAYETLSETEWSTPHNSNVFIPNVYNDISDFLDIKLRAMACYHSQLSEFPNPRSLGAVEALAKYRGSTILASAAEAFALIREIR